MRVACVANAPIPYHTPLFNALAQIETLDLHVLYMSQDDRADRFRNTWGETPDFPHSFHQSITLGVERLDLRLQIAVGSWRLLRQLNPDGILVISWHPITFEPIMWAKATGRSVTMWAESTVHSGLLRGRVSTGIRKRLLKSVDSFVANGSRAAEYLRYLDVPARKVVTSCLPVPAASDSTRELSSAYPSPAFLYVGRLIQRKHPVELINAFDDVRAALPSATLTVVGSGPLEAEVRAAAQHRGGVTVLGHCEGEELHRLYRRSDILVLPSEREVWGLVVNEALQHGLYVLATDQVGSTADLIDSSNGTIFPIADLPHLGTFLVQVGETVDISNQARLARSATIEHCSPANWAADVHAALQLGGSTRAEQHAGRRE